MERKGLQVHQILGIIAIIALLGLTVYVALQQTNLLSQAGTSEDPKFINVVNENESGFTVIWISTKETQGTVILTDENLTFMEEEDDSKTHIIEITGLESGRRYEFKVLSGTVLDNNEGNNYEAYTAKSSITTNNKLLFGRIFGKDSVTPLSEGYITIEAENDNFVSNKIYSQLNDQGGWQLDYSLLMSNSLTQRFDYTEKSLVTLTIYSPEITEPVTRSYDINLSETLQITDIFLGEDVPWELPAVEDESLQSDE